MKKLVSQDAITAVLVDDEQRSRDLLRYYLAGCPGVRVAGEAASVQDACDLCERLRPDVVFLDIVMPGNNGFSLLTKLQPLPHIIFVTAHDEFAVRAFDIGSLDFVMKPLRQERIHLAIERLQRRIQAAAPAGPSPGLQENDTVIIPVERSFTIVPTRSIALIIADSNYSEVKLTDGRIFYVYRTVGEWERLLPHGIFIRLDRSTLLAPEHVNKIKRVCREQAFVHLTGVLDALEIKRAGLERLLAVLNGVPLKTTSRRRSLPPQKSQGSLI